MPNLHSSVVNLKAMAVRLLENRGVFEDVYFSVVSHPDNSFLDKTMNEYRALTNNSPKFYDFKSNALVDVAVDYLPDWSNWYKKVYLGIE